MGCGCGNKNKGDNTVARAAGKSGFTPPTDENRVPVVMQQSESPSLLKKALNFGEAITKHVGDGLTTVDPNELSARLTICNKCIHNQAGTCNKCGCILTTKAKWRTSTCPEGYWPETKKQE